MINDFINDENGSTSVEMALLFPVILALIMFALWINMLYEGKIATSIGANEALRYAVTQTSYNSAKETAETRLRDVYKQHKIKMQSVKLTHIDTNKDGKYSIGDTLVLQVQTKKGVWCNYTYELHARVEDDTVRRG